MSVRLVKPFFYSFHSDLRAQWRTCIHQDCAFDLIRIRLDDLSPFPHLLYGHGEGCYSTVEVMDIVYACVCVGTVHAVFDGIGEPSGRTAGHGGSCGRWNASSWSLEGALRAGGREIGMGWGEDSAVGTGVGV